MANKKSTTTSSGGDQRTRNWAFFVYPDSAPGNWRDILNELHVPWVESPLHDKDVDDGTGELKKPHWHIVLMFDNKKSFSQIKEITDSLNSPIPQKCHSAKGAVRYMLHLDSPDKYQYDRAELKAHGGADLADLLRPTSSSRYELIREMTRHIRAENILHFAALVDYAEEHRPDDWYPLLCDNSTVFIKEYVKSRWQMAGGGARG